MVSSTKVDPLYIGLIITVSLILLTVALASFKMLRSNRVRSNSKTLISTFSLKDFLFNNIWLYHVVLNRMSIQFWKWTCRAVAVCTYYFIIWKLAKYKTNGQEKVDQLDVKFALVEVKKKMGVNSLYSHRDEVNNQILWNI